MVFFKITLRLVEPLWERLPCNHLELLVEGFPNAGPTGEPMVPIPVITFPVNLWFSNRATEPLDLWAGSTFLFRVDAWLVRDTWRRSNARPRPGLLLPIRSFRP